MKKLLLLLVILTSCSTIGNRIDCKDLTFKNLRAELLKNNFTIVFSDEENHIVNAKYALYNAKIDYVISVNENNIEVICTGDSEFGKVYHKVKHRGEFKPILKFIETQCNSKFVDYELGK